MPSHRILHIAIISLILLGCLATGFRIARHKALWLDEIHTQTKDVEWLSWQEIWGGQIPDRSNLPLFFSIQKAIGKVLHYNSSNLWSFQDIHDRLMTRICPVVFMSLAITMIFWYFLQLEGLLGGALALLVTLTSFMVWSYWAETRPYALMLFGTAWQALALNAFLRQPPDKRDLRPIAASHWFLALTSSISMIQITAAAMVLWVAGVRRFWQIILCSVLPFAVILFYYSHVSPCKMWFSPTAGPVNLLAANIHPLRFLAIIALLTALVALKSIYRRPVPRSIWLMSLWIGLMMAGHMSLMIYMKLLAVPTEEGAAEVSCRYFIPLTAVGIVGVLLLFFELLRQLKDQRLKWLAWALILALTLARAPKTWDWIKSHRVFDSSAEKTCILP